MRNFKDLLYTTAAVLSMNMENCLIYTFELTKLPPFVLPRNVCNAQMKQQWHLISKAKFNACLIVIEQFTTFLLNTVLKQDHASKPRIAIELCWWDFGGLCYPL